MAPGSLSAPPASRAHLTARGSTPFSSSCSGVSSIWVLVCALPSCGRRVVFGDPHPGAGRQCPGGQDLPAPSPSQALRDPVSCDSVRRTKPPAARTAPQPYRRAAWCAQGCSLTQPFSGEGSALSPPAGGTREGRRGLQVSFSLSYGPARIGEAPAGEGAAPPARRL